MWDVERGEMVFHFNDLHDTKMTAMAFDEAVADVWWNPRDPSEP